MQRIVTDRHEADKLLEQGWTVVHMVGAHIPHTLSNIPQYLTLAFVLESPKAKMPETDKSLL